MNQTLLELIEELIDTKIDMNNISNSEGSDGYRETPPNELYKKIDRIKSQILKLKS